MYMRCDERCQKTFPHSKNIKVGYFLQVRIDVLSVIFRVGDTERACILAVPYGRACSVSLSTRFTVPAHGRETLLHVQGFT